MYSYSRERRTAIMDYVEQIGGTASYRDISVVFTLIHDNMQYVPKEHRGRLSKYIQSVVKNGHKYEGILRHPKSYDSRYLIKIGRGLYKLVK